MNIPYVTHESVMESVGKAETSEGPTMTDPIASFVFQPLVDVLRLCPRGAGRRATDLFAMFAITTAAVRIVTGGPEPDPWFNGMQSANMVIGMCMLWPFVRFFASNGPVAISGLFSYIHLGMRLVFLATTLSDVMTVAMMIGGHDDYAAVGMLRQILQLLVQASAMSALYLAMCKDPPPPLDDGRLATV